MLLKSSGTLKNRKFTAVIVKLNIPVLIKCSVSASFLLLYRYLNYGFSILLRFAIAQVTP
jgi:hypothetical protein